MTAKQEGPFIAPSGRVLYPNDLELLRALEKNGTISWSETDVVFNSGFLSRVYFRGRNDLSHNMPLLMQVAVCAKKYVAELLNTHGPQKCLIGIPTAGTQLAQAVADLSYFEASSDGYLSSRPESLICFSTMRSKLKDHGKDNMWVGHPELKKHTYISFENIVSTAKAMLEAFGRLEQDGYPTRDMNHVVFADWGLGGIEALADAGYGHVHTLYVMMDAIAAFVHMRMWPEKRYLEMDRRIREWNAAHKPE